MSQPPLYVWHKYPYMYGTTLRCMMPYLDVWRNHHYTCM